ncbi:MAG: hypothetical protein JO235_27600 [Chroococcidiopsidaceae cyanobacterium CP_BM_RX_35]|nr:hypothetical protein [Chroococcidiopsidaceae cyanobacterium CP_BM_RX_35]
MVSQLPYEALTQHDAILPCPDFQISEDLQEQTIELTLTLRDWKQIMRSRSKSNLSKKIVSQIRQALSIYDDETFETDEIPF